MALPTLRVYANPSSVVFDAGVLTVWYAEDGLQVKGAIQDGSIDLKALIVYAEDGVQLNETNSQPSAALAARGRIWIIKGAGGTADKIQICLKKSDDTYAWYDLMEAG